MSFGIGGFPFGVFSSFNFNPTNSRPASSIFLYYDLQITAVQFESVVLIIFKALTVKFLH